MIFKNLFIDNKIKGKVVFVLVFTASKNILSSLYKAPFHFGLVSSVH
jgi:hypothetical protein